MRISRLLKITILLEKMRKKIFILVFFILVATAVIFLFCLKDNIQESAPTAVLNPDDRGYVRLSLFNTLPDKISLQIPEDWEGSYRVKDNGNLANIFFIDGPDEWELLSFKQFSQSEWEKNFDKNWQKIMEDNGLIIAYKLSTGGDISSYQMSKFNNMRADVSGLLKSIKIR